MGTGVAHIGDYAFQECESLTSVDPPASVTSIGADVFIDSGCPAGTFKAGAKVCDCRVC